MKAIIFAFEPTRFSNRFKGIHNQVSQTLKYFYTWLHVRSQQFLLGAI